MQHTLALIWILCPALICVLKVLIWNGIHPTVAYVVGFDKWQHEMCVVESPKLVFMCKCVITVCLFYGSMTVLDEWGLSSVRGRNFCLRCNMKIESGPDAVSCATRDGILFHL
jgi:hypothetical protein